MSGWIALKLVVFVFATAAILFVSRAPLRDPRSHGFYRFFAWEAILILILLNVDHWFENPLRPTQIVSWLLLAVSIFLVIDGTRQLRLGGNPDANREHSSLYTFEKTTTLVTAGVFKYIRHPMYSSLLFLAWGVFLKSPSWIGAGLAVLTTLFLTATARREEAEDLEYFGRVYGDYMRQTRMFIPFIL